MKVNLMPKSLKRRQASLAIGALAIAPVFAQDLAQRGSPIRLIVGYPPGGGGDILVRPLSKRLSQFLSQPVVLENKPGAGGTLAANQIAMSQPDGLTVFMADSSILLAPGVYEKLGYDPASLTPVCGTGQLAYCVVVHPSVPARNIAELIQWLKVSPGKYSYASPGVGNVAHLAAEYFKQYAGVEMVHVPYKGGGPAIVDLIGGQVPICFISLPPAIAQAQAGKLRILGVTTAKRWEKIPEVPAISETLAGFEMVTNMFVVAPPKTPSSIVDRLAAGFRNALDDAEIRQTYLSAGASIEIRSPEALAIQMAAELKRWPDFLKSIGIRPGNT